MAKYIVTQYGGPNGELGAAIRYLNQRYTMPDAKGKALLNDIGTEELAHVEMICTMVSQMMKGATIDELRENDLLGYLNECTNLLRKANGTYTANDDALANVANNS